MKQQAMRMKSAGAALRGNLAEGLLLAGSAFVSFGAWMIYPPAGFIVGGVILLFAGVVVARAGES